MLLMTHPVLTIWLSERLESGYTSIYPMIHNEEAADEWLEGLSFLFDQIATNNKLTALISLDHGILTTITAKVLVGAALLPEILNRLQMHIASIYCELYSENGKSDVNNFVKLLQSKPELLLLLILECETPD